MAPIRYDEEVKEQIIHSFFKLALPVLFPFYFLCHAYDWAVAPDYAWFFLGIRLTLLPLIGFFVFIFKKKWPGLWHATFIWIFSLLISTQMAYMASVSGRPLAYLLGTLMMGCAFLMLFPLPAKQNLVTVLAILFPYFTYLMLETSGPEFRLSMFFQA